ncbi:MAG: fatty acid desaturase [Moraxellaceae bacterium]|nr:fatty acid desaturase [Moraxellaceae bacterium]
MIDTKSPQEIEFRQHASINWIPAFILIVTPLLAVFIVPWYLWTHSISLTTWLVFVFFMTWTGMGITAGYHRLLSHRAYKVHPFVKNFLLVGATFAIQSSAFDWCSGHRIHHKFVDDEYKDPYSARRGFLFSHIGWMLRNYPSSRFDYKNIADLKKDKILCHQHKYYGLWIVATNLVVLPIIGWLIGDIWGVMVLAGLLRLVLTHHFTFFINSLCHMFGSRPYTDTNTARDNFILALFTWGEGYHNYHHYFEHDYRNGIKWWQYDPTKWLIFALSKVNLASKLKRVDDATIKKAQLEMRFKRTQTKLDKIEEFLTMVNAKRDEFTEFKARINQERLAFQQTMEEWQALKKQQMEMKRAKLSQKLQNADEKMKEQFQQMEEKIIYHSQQFEKTFEQLRLVPVSVK